MITSFTILQQGPTYTFLWQPATAAAESPAAGTYSRWATTSLQPHQQAELQAAIDSAAQAAGQLRPSGTENNLPLLRLGRLLFSHLLPPPLQDLIRRLPPATPLCICTNDTELPWELLHDDQDFLALRHDVTRQLLANGDASSSAQLPPQLLNCLLIGNPTNDLPAADVEVENLLDLLETAPQQVRVEFLCREHASKMRVLAALASGNYELIHFACHARPGALRLSDGWLDAEEIRTVLRGRPMVVLNACSSGRTRAGHSNELPFSGQQVQGLAQAFLLGGATMFLGAAWTVDDDEIRGLALEFYRWLLGGHAIGAALRHARTRSQRKASQATSWSAPVLYGDPRHRLPHAALQRLPGTILTARVGLSQDLANGESLDAYARRIQQLVNQLVAVVKSFGGEVISLRPEFLRVLFGIPTPVEDDAVRALCAALEIRSIVDKQAGPAGAGSSAAVCAIAITSGEIAMAVLSPQAVPGDSDSGAHAASYLYLGSLFDEADALLRQGQSNQVLANERAHQLAHGRFTFVPRMAGGEHPAPLCYEVAAADDDEFGPHGSADTDLDMPGQLLGRERELSLLSDYWRAASHGRGQVVGIVGEAGVGKTRVLQEFRRTLAADPHLWIDLACSSTGRDTPYSLVGQLLRQIFGILPRDGDEAAQAKIALGLAELPGGPTAADPQINQILRETLGLSTSDVPVDERKARRGRLVNLLRTLMANVAQQQPLLIAIDDLHWIDEASLELLGQVTDGIHRLPVQFLVLYRPEWQHSWFDKPYYRHLPLEQLDQVASFDLLRVLLQSARLPNGLSVLLQKTGGNPFFIAEMVKSLQESSILVQRAALGQPDAKVWELRRPLSEVQLPGTVERTLRVRLESLTPATRAVLETAAVIGPTFGLPLLQQLLETMAEDLEPALAELEQRGFIEASWDVQEYRFRHALILDTVYQSMTNAQHQAWNRRIAEVLAAGSQPPELEKLARHYYYSLLLSRPAELPKVDERGNPQHVAKGVACLVQCGQRALERYAAREAINYYQRALLLNRLLPDNYGADVASREGMGDAFNVLGDFDAAYRELRLAYAALHTHPLTRSDRRRAADLARRIGRLCAWRGEHEVALAWMGEGLFGLGEPLDDEDKAVAALLHVHTGSVEYNRGNYALVVRECERGLQLAGFGLGRQLPAQAEAGNLLGIIAWANGRIEEALAHYAQSRIAWLALGNSYQAARVEGNMGVAYFYLAQWEQARLHHTRCKEYWEQIEDQDMLAHPCLNLGNIYLCQGDWEQAEVHFSRALELWSNAHHKRFMALAHTNLGLLYIEQEEWVKARIQLEESYAILTQSNIRDLLSEVLSALAEVALGAGNLPQALDLATEARNLAVELAMRAEEALALRILGRIHLAQGEVEPALACLQEALAITQEVENRYEEARTLYYLAQVEVRAGDASAATHLDQALKSLTALGANHDCQRAERLAATF